MPCPQVTITVLDENDNSPQFDITSDSSVSVAEDSAVGKRVAVVLARDPDAGSNGQVGEAGVEGLGLPLRLRFRKRLHRCLPNPFPSSPSLPEQTGRRGQRFGRGLRGGYRVLPGQGVPAREGQASSLGWPGQRALRDTCQQEPGNLKTSCGLSQHGERQRSPWQAEQEALGHLLLSLAGRQALTRPRHP